MHFLIRLVNFVFPFRWLASISLVFLLDLTTWLAFNKTTSPQIMHQQDKLLHVLAFFGLFCLGHISLHFDFRPRFRPLFALIFNAGFLLAYGLFIEMVQKHLSYRTASLGDVIADAIGILIGALFVTVLKLYPTGATHPHGQD